MSRVCAGRGFGVRQGVAESGGQAVAGHVTSLIMDRITE